MKAPHPFREPAGRHHPRLWECPHCHREFAAPGTVHEPCSPAGALTVAIEAVKVAPAGPALDATQAWDATALWGPPRTEPAPARHRRPESFTAATVLHRDLLLSLRIDYAGLPLFRGVAKDKFTLHQLAMRAPHTSGGNQ